MRAGLPATKLVCTLGPATEDLVPELVSAGMSVARLNLSHGDPDEHARAVVAVRAAEAKAGRPVAILADLPGPKVRLGELEGGELELAPGSPFELRSPGTGAGPGPGATTTHAGLAEDLREHDSLLLADGAVELRVTALAPGRVSTIVERGGVARSGGGVGVPSERLSMPALGERDRELARFAAGLGVDLVGQSFVRSADDVRGLRELLGPDGPGIVAKVETRPATEAVEAILEVADALMVARGDLGVELPFEAVPLVQLRMLDAGRRAGRPVIVATQMLESMTVAPRPTRAEVSDVANAVLDGADAVLLSAETAIGRFPLLAAQAALRIAAAVEDAPSRASSPESSRPVEPAARDALAVALAAAEVAETDRDVDAIVTFTRSGRTARILAARRPRVPIVALAPDPRVARRLALLRGVEPVVVEADSEPAPTLDAAVARLAGERRVAAGRAVLLVATSAGTGSPPNLLEIRRVS